MKLDNYKVGRIDRSSKLATFEHFTRHYASPSLESHSYTNLKKTKINSCIQIGGTPQNAKALFE